ncbi:hypothetical protein EX30DRAFT_235070 [Ascodesmis nigricans]|uniref:Cutinase n=1 Tax=Ascodesmis nigricans TaxID=341454 RepID=A0A4V3SIX4_9PEZI|nr:hypothetical protein EX30DRAFT_235070 [Ascodesmis nigricans]
MNVLALALALLPLTIGAPIELEKRQAGNCPPLEIIFARGTTEPQGLGTLGAPLQREVNALIPGTTATAVVYPASANFMASASQGSTWATDYLNKQAAACPQTKFVLGGYSQGAMVVHGVNPDASVKDRIVAVAVFGDPYRSMSQYNKAAVSKGGNTKRDALPEAEPTFDFLSGLGSGDLSSLKEKISGLSSSGFDLGDLTDLLGNGGSGGLADLLGDGSTGGLGSLLEKLKGGSAGSGLGDLGGIRDKDSSSGSGSSNAPAPVASDSPTIPPNTETSPSDSDSSSSSSDSPLRGLLGGSGGLGGLLGGGSGGISDLIGSIGSGSGSGLSDLIGGGSGGLGSLLGNIGGSSGSSGGLGSLLGSIWGGSSGSGSSLGGASGGLGSLLGGGSGSASSASSGLLSGGLGGWPISNKDDVFSACATSDTVCGSDANSKYSGSHLSYG